MRPDGHLSDERQPLGGGPPAMANADLDEETDVLAKEHDSEEAPKADGSDSDYRPSARQTTRSRRAAARGRPPRRRISHYKVCRCCLRSTRSGVGAGPAMGHGMQRAEGLYVEVNANPKSLAAFSFTSVKMEKKASAADAIFLCCGNVNEISDLLADCTCILVQGKEKKKVGRPITYKGDPEANDLTEEERRRIKRRIANRESARRVRQKRHDLMDDLQVNVRGPFFL